MLDEKRPHRTLDTLKEVEIVYFRLKKNDWVCEEIVFGVFTLRGDKAIISGKVECSTEGDNSSFTTVQRDIETTKMNGFVRLQINFYYEKKMKIKQVSTPC